MEIRYSYGAVPTVREFARSDAFLRGLMGPFGCLPGYTEFLTPTGWKRMDEYEASDLVCQWSPDGSTEFVKPLRYVETPAPEGFIEFDSGSLKMALSPDHRVPHYNWAGEFRVKSAAQIAERPSKRTIPTTFKCPVSDYERLALSDALIRFAVMMHADGHYPKSGRRAAVCVRKEHKKVRVREVLSALSVEWDEFVYPKRPTEVTFKFVPPYVGKHFVGSWWGASELQLRLVLDEMSHWDGLHDHAELRFFTTHKEDADFMQYAAHATGRRAAIHRTTYAGKAWKVGYSVNIRVDDNPKNRAMVRGDTTKIRKRDGNVLTKQYCFEVPSSFFVVRHEDTVFVTGNSGKSSGAVMEFPRRAKAQVPGPDGKRHTRWAVIRGTYRQLMDTTVKTFHQWFPPHIFGTYNVTNMTYQIEAWEGCDCEVLFRALDRPDHVDNLLSLELTGAWVNEARETPWTIIEALQGRVGRWPAKRDGGPSWYGVWLDTNPPDSDSRWYKYFEEWLPSEEGQAANEALKQREGRDLAAIFKQPSGLSPEAENLANLPNGRGYYETMAAGKDREWVKVYVDGQYGYVADGRPVFPEYNDTIHCNEKAEPIRGEPLYRGWDFGLTPACAFGQLNRFGQFVLFDELTSEEMGIDRFGDAVLEHCTKQWSRAKLGWDPEWIDIGDPAGMQRAPTDERTCFQVLAAKGLMLEPGLQTLALRLESLRKPLTILKAGRPGFLLNPRCKMLRKGFMGGYQFRRMNTVREKFTDKPDKNELSHVMDGAEYIATILFGTGLTTERPRVPNKRDALDELPDPSRDSTTGY